MGYKGKSVQGEIPESGAIFMSNIRTYKECLERKLFGLPSGMSNFVLQVKEGMPLFLFEFERRLLYGVFRATCDGEINIDPKAFRSSGKQFPAQVRFTTVYDCSPLAEHEFKDVIMGNYYSGKKFHFGLNKKQVSNLMKLFRSRFISRNHPERSIRRYDEKPSEGNARYVDLRKDIRHERPSEGNARSVDLRKDIRHEKPSEGNSRSVDLRNDIRHRLRFDSCDSRGDVVKEVDDDMYINKHLIESRQDEKRDGFLTHYTTASGEFGDCSGHDVLGKHLDLREKDIEDGYMPVFSKPHGTYLDEIGGSSDFLMDGENKDILDYNRLRDEYNVRQRLRGNLNEYTLSNHGFSHFNQNDYSNCDPTRIDVPDIQLSPSCFDDQSGFIPIANNCPFYPSPEKIPMSRSLSYYSHDEGSNRYLDDPVSQSSIFPKFISRNLSSSDAGLRVHEEDPTYNDKRFFENHESKHSFGTTDKRVSVFSRLTTTLRHEEQDFESDEKHKLNSSVDNVMKMLEKVASSPKKRSGKSISVYKQDDADNSPDSKIDDYKFPDVNFEDDADVAYEEVEGESVFQETRLVDFKRRRNSNKTTDGTSKENSECLVVGATSDVGPVANDQLTGMPHKRRKLVRPAFVEKNVTPDSVSVSAHENTLSSNDNADVVLESSEKVDEFVNPMVATCPENTLSSNDNTDVVLESSEKVDEFINPMVATCPENTLSSNDNTDIVLESSEKVDEFINPMVATCPENTPDDGNSTKAGTESSKEVDVSIKHIDLNMLPTCDESSSPKYDNNSTKFVPESQKSGNEGDGNRKSRLVSDVFVEGTAPKDDQKMCGWIDW